MHFWELHAGSHSMIWDERGKAYLQNGIYELMMQFP